MGLGRYNVGRQALRELGLVAAGLLIYFLIRANVIDETREATAHAIQIVHFERWIGFFWEPHLQRLLGHGLVEIQFWNAIYFWGHAPVIAAIAVWLYLVNRRRYSLIRNAFLVSAVIGLIVYRFYPVAPPRLLPGFGFVDTMRRYSDLSYQAESLKPFVNPYAAVPSLHFGWSLLIGAGLILAIQRPLGWLAGLLLPTLMFFAIVVTGNHFIFDAVTGLLAAGAGLLGAYGYQYWHDRRTALSRATRPAEAHEPARIRAG